MNIVLAAKEKVLHTLQLFKAGSGYRGGRSSLEEGKVYETHFQERGRGRFGLCERRIIDDTDPWHKQAAVAIFNGQIFLCA